jgi:HEAT repeat protein
MRRSCRRFRAAALCAALVAGAATAHATESLPRNTPDEVREPLEKLLSEDSKERYAGRKELRAMGTEAESAIPVLLELVARDMDGRTAANARFSKRARAAADSLFDFDRRAHADLLAALGSRKLRFSRAAAWVLSYEPPADAGPQLVKAVRDNDTVTRTYALAALRKVQDPETVPAVAACLRDRDQEVRKQAILCLAAVETKRSRAELAGLLRHTELEMRRATADAVGQAKRNDLLPELLNAFRNEREPYARYWMAVGLGMLENPKAVPLLSQRLKTETDKAVLEKIAAALGKIGDVAACPHLVRAMRTRKDELSLLRTGAWALGELKDPRGVDALLPLLKSDDEWVRKNAAEALAKICYEAPKLGEDHGKWTAWWTKNRRRLL